MINNSGIINNGNNNVNIIRGNILENLNKNAVQGQTNVESGVQEEIDKAKSERQSYLDSLSGVN